MTTLTRWLLRAFADEWPGGLPESGDAGGPLYLEDRDESTVVEVDTSTDPTTLTGGRPSKDFDHSAGNTLGVALTDYPQRPAGLGGQEYSAEPVLSVRIGGASEWHSGHIADGDEFENDLVLTAVEVVQNIDNGTLQAAPVANFHVAEPDDQRPNMEQSATFYEWSFDVRAQGYRTV